MNCKIHGNQRFAMIEGKMSCSICYENDVRASRCRHRFEPMPTKPMIVTLELRDFSGKLLRVDKFRADYGMGYNFSPFIDRPGNYQVNMRFEEEQ